MRVLISTIYEESDSTKLSIRDFGVQKIFFLIDKSASEKQLKSIEMIKKAFGSTIEINEKRVELYDILSISSSAVKIIDSLPRGSSIYVDITQGRKPQAFGLLLACYARPDKIEHIVYWNNKNEMTVMPKFSFNVGEEEKRILMKLEVDKVSKLIKSLRISKATLYRSIKRLEGSGLIKKDNGRYMLTDAGRIAIL